MPDKSIKVLRIKRCPMISYSHRIQIEWTSLSKKMQGLAWEFFFVLSELNQAKLGLVKFRQSC